jgi:hypothetical protein
VCNTILSLVDAGAINVSAPPAAATAARSNGTNGATTRTRAPETDVQPEAPYGPGVESPHPGPNSAAPEEVERVIDPAEKGRYLSAFSGLRD